MAAQTTYSSIFIIFNPNSTGDSESMAKELEAKLQKALSKTKITRIATKRAGHAQELARDIAAKEKAPLIISSSGDGGYNEVVNGVMESKNSRAICAVLAAGNANDHGRTMQDKPLHQQIIRHKVTEIDLIKVTAGKATRYAHSYVGLGLTPVVATELNRHSLNAVKETWLAVSTFFAYRPFKIRHENKIVRLDSLLFANINQMAKVLTLAEENRPDDGKFEIILFPAGRKWGLIKRLSKAAITKLETTNRASKFTFTVIKKMPMQLDGEVMVLQADDEVIIKSAHKALKTIV
jgi:diacylglycerol kinase family enzyme